MKHKSCIIYFIFTLLSLLYYQNVSGSFSYIGVTPTVMCEGNAGLLTFKVSSFYAGYSYHISGPGIVPTTVISLGSGTTQSLQVALSSYVSAGTYQYKIVLFAPNNTTPLKTVNVSYSYLQAPVFITPIVDAHACEGSTLSISANTLGTITSYQWEQALRQSNEWKIVGTTSVLTIPNVSTSIEDYFFRCKIRNKGCTESTSNHFAIHAGAPMIFQQPENVRVCEKSIIELKIGALGENIGYQWEYLQNDTWVSVIESDAIQGTTTATLKFVATTSLDNTSFRCQISSNCGNTTSLSSLVNVVSNPVNPVAVFIPECTATGTTTQRTLKITNPQIGIGYNILTPNYAVVHSYTHETGPEATLTLTNLSSSDNRVIIYSFSPSDLGCTSENVVVSLLGSGNVLIGEQPQSVTACHEEPATFHVGNITGIPLSGGMQYQWEIDSGSGFTAIQNIPSQISGTTTPDLTFHTGTLSFGSLYNNINLRCKVTGQCGSIYSDEATLAIRQPINISYNIEPVGYYSQGSTYVLRGTLNNVLPDVHYYFSSPDGNLKQNYTNPTTSIQNNVAVQVPNLEPGILSLKVKANYASTPSCTQETNITLPNQTLPLISKHPQDVAVLQGSDVTFECQCLSEGRAVEYSWFRSRDGQSFVLIFPYESNRTLILSGVGTADNGFFYRCVVNFSGTAIAQFTRAAMLTVYQSSASRATYEKPLSKTICSTEEILTTTIGNAIEGYAYQWQVFESDAWTNLLDNRTYSGTKTTSITVHSPVENRTYRVRCEITERTSGLKTTTESVDLKKVSLPTQIIKDSELSLCSPITDKASSLSLSVPSKAGQTYLWNTKEKTSSILVRENGNYHITVGLDGCTTRLDIEITDFHQDNLNLDIQGVSNLTCTPASLEKQEFTLPQGFATYQWSASTTSATNNTASYSIFINDPTTILATVKDTKNCTVARTHTVTPANNISPNVEYVRTCIGAPTLIQGSARNEVTQWLWYNIEGTLISQGRPFVYIAQQGAYILKVLYTDGCVGTRYFNVDFEISNTTIANKNTQKEIFFCEQTPITLSTTTTHSTYSWTGPNGFLGSSSTVTVSDEGKYYVTTTNADKTCPGIDTVHLRKYPAPPVEITASNQKICTLTPGIFKPNKRLNAPSGYVSYLWNTGEIGVFIEVDQLGTHDYTLTVVDNHGCSNTITYPVSIDDVGIHNKENASCARGDLALEGTEGLYDYEWEWSLNGVPQTLENPNSRPQLFNITANSTLTLKVMERNNPTCFITDIATVQLGDAPKVTITPTPNHTICRGGTVTLTGNIVGEIHNTQWIYNGQSIGTNLSTTVDKPGNYKIIVENTSTGCKATEIQNITLQELPKAVILPYQKVCLGHTTTLTATVPGEMATDYTYVWQDTFANAVYPVKQPGNYTVKVKHNVTGCESQKSVTVDFLNVPPPTIIGHQSFTATTLFNVGVLENYVSYLWCTESTENNIILPQNSQCSLTVTDNKGCIASTNFSTNPNISILSITISAPNVCYGVPIEFTLDGGFKAYQWYVNGKLLPFETENKLKLKEVGEYQVYATAEDYYNNSITTSTVGVTIKPSPDVSIQGTRTFCDAMPAQFSLTASMTTLAAYEWIKDGTPISSDPNLPYQVSFINTPAVEGIYTLRATAINGCMTEVSDSIILRKSQAVVIAPTVACTGDTILLKASPGYEQYIWQEGGIDVVTNLHYKAFRTGRYSVKVQDKYGCSFQTPGHSILFSQNVNFAIIGRNTVCQDDSVELKVSEIFTQYLWSTGETTPSIYVKEQNTYSITAFNSNTCSSTQEIMVYKRPKYNVVVRDTACLGTPYRFGSRSITEPGIYQHQFLSTEGCDSTVTLSLVFTDPPQPINIALNENGILHLVNFNQKGVIEWFAENQLMIRANEIQYEPLRNGQFHARFVKAGSCAVLSNNINVNIYSPIDVSIQKNLVEKNRKTPYYFNDVVPYKITVINETELIGTNIVLQITDFFNKDIFSLSTDHAENINWSVEGGDNNNTRISQIITIPEFKPKDSVHLFIYLRTESAGKLTNNAEVTLLQDNGKFAKEYYDYLYNNKAQADCNVRFSVSQLPVRYVVTTNGSPANRCVVIRPENQFTTEFYKIQVFLYNRMGQQVYNHQNFENKELCSEDFPAGTFIFVMKFTEIDSKRENTITGTITNIK